VFGFLFLGLLLNGFEIVVYSEKKLLLKVLNFEQIFARLLVIRETFSTFK